MATIFTLPDGRKIGQGTAFTLTKLGVDYSFATNWLQCAKPADLKAWGITSETIEEPDIRPPAAPDATLSDWRVALISMGRFQEVEAAVLAAKESGTPEGLVAWQRFEYANHVFRGELMELAPVMGFSEAEVDESLVRAAAIAAG